MSAFSTQLSQVHVAFVVGVFPRDVSRQHAGIRGRDIFRDERHSNPRFWVHGEVFQDVHVRVPTTDEDDVFDDVIMVRACRLHFPQNGFNGGTHNRSTFVPNVAKASLRRRRRRRRRRRKNPTSSTSARQPPRRVFPVVMKETRLKDSSRSSKRCCLHEIVSYSMR